ncbi:MAG: glycosyl transferase [Candidatus Taylorbacteria bacterium]|nr:glycosyl transferase [Candidatus Taylorbacteria bacterium]
MTNPLISVIIPTHNNAKTIRAAIESICNQTYKNLEIIVVDDGSTDNTKQIAEGLVLKDSRIIYTLLDMSDPFPRINKKGRNINAGYLARNHGLLKAKGELITFQDGDDVSFKNRIEIEFKLLNLYKADHICVDWQQFSEDLENREFDYERFVKETDIKILTPDEIYRQARKAKGIFYKLFPFFGKYIPFEIKTARIVNKLFFGNLSPYPGSANCPLLKKSLTDKIKFRPLPERVWPSFTGRGVDRDFNFEIAETFKQSYTIFVPIYLWRMDIQNDNYKKDISKFIKQSNEI